MFSLNEMLQRRKWKKGVVRRDGSGVKITVSPPETGIDLVAPLTSLFMWFGLFWIIGSNLRWPKSLTDLLWEALPGLVFGLFLFFLTRAIYERSFAEEVVTIGTGTITWARKTKWWTRKRRLEMSKVTDIFADTGWTGLGHVRITTKWQRYTIIYDLLNEDAIRFARELKRAVQ
jgi:hypothetical protein